MRFVCPVKFVSAVNLFGCAVTPMGHRSDSFTIPYTAALSSEPKVILTAGWVKLSC